VQLRNYSTRAKAKGQSNPTYPDEEEELPYNYDKWQTTPPQLKLNGQDVGRSKSAMARSSMNSEGYRKISVTSNTSKNDSSPKKKGLLQRFADFIQK